MLVEIISRKTTEERKTVDLQLPAYFKDDKDHFYCISDEKNVLDASKYGIQNFGDYDLNKIAGYESASESEFIAAYTLAKIRTNFELPSWAGAKTASDND